MHLSSFSRLAVFGATLAACSSSSARATYTLDGASHDLPAQGLSAEPGNAAGHPAWTAALFAVPARADVDNGRVCLRAPMPDWLRIPNPVIRQPLTTQDSPTCPRS